MPTAIEQVDTGAREAPTGRVNAIDPDVGALEYAAWSLGSLGLAGIDVELGASSVEDLPFGTGSFDAAWCSGVLGYVDAPERALDELVRVVRPGGRVVVVAGDAARATWLPIEPELELAIRRAELSALRAGHGVTRTSTWGDGSGSWRTGFPFDGPSRAPWSGSAAPRCP